MRKEKKENRRRKKSTQEKLKEYTKEENQQHMIKGKEIRHFTDKERRGCLQLRDKPYRKKKGKQEATTDRDEKKEKMWGKRSGYKLEGKRPSPKKKRNR